MKRLSAADRVNFRDGSINEKIYSIAFFFLTMVFLFGCGEETFLYKDKTIVPERFSPGYFFL